MNEHSNSLLIKLLLTQSLDCILACNSKNPVICTQNHVNEATKLCVIEVSVSVYLFTLIRIFTTPLFCIIACPKYVNDHEFGTRWPLSQNFWGTVIAYFVHENVPVYMYSSRAITWWFHGTSCHASLALTFPHTSQYLFFGGWGMGTQCYLYLQKDIQIKHQSVHGW